MISQPMLAVSTENYQALFDGRTYLISPKIDGIRCLSENNEAYSRSGKLFRNKHIQSLFSSIPDNLDGELLSCKIEPNITFSDYTKDIMTINGIPNIKYYVFDYIDSKMTAIERYNKLLSMKDSLPDWVIIVPQIKISDFHSMESLEKAFLEEGYEGAMLKDSNGTYKFGRSTIKEKKLIKVKRFEDEEAIIIGFEELFHNNNEAEENEFGYIKRSSSYHNLSPADTLGSLKVKTINREKNVEFNIGSGFTQKIRDEIWQNKEKYINSIIKFKHFKLGSQELPRLPVWIGFRELSDL